MSTAGWRERPGGVRLRTRGWEPSGERRGGLLLVHGIAEHSGRYDHVGSFFAARGWEVAAYDHRGHGESSGRRMYLERWDDLLDDLQVGLAALPVGNRGVYGHSLGALIALDNSLSSRLRPDWLVLSAPPLRGGKAWQRLAAPVLEKLAPKLALPNRLTPEQLSRDQAVGRAYFADRLVARKTTGRFGALMFDAMRSVRNRLDQLAVPTLVIHGGDDTLIPPEISLPLASIPSVQRRLYPALRHELHNEPEQLEVLSDIEVWITSRS